MSHLIQPTQEHAAHLSQVLSNLILVSEADPCRTSSILSDMLSNYVLSPNAKHKAEALTAVGDLQRLLVSVSNCYNSIDAGKEFFNELMEPCNK